MFVQECRRANLSVCIDEALSLGGDHKINWRKERCTKRVSGERREGRSFSREGRGKKDNKGREEGRA